MVMARISDRTVVGTLAAGQTSPHVGLQGTQRLERNRNRLRTYVACLPKIKLNQTISFSGFYSCLAKRLEEHFGFSAGTLSVAQLTSATYRKTTLMSQLDMHGKPWAIMKAFSENQLGHQSLRAMREHNGSAIFNSFEGVVAPDIIGVFNLTGPHFPQYNLIVVERLLPGKPALHFLELAAKQEEEERAQTLEKMRNMFARAAYMLSVVHQMVAGQEILELNMIRDEGDALIKHLQEQGFFTVPVAAQVKRVLHKHYERIKRQEVILAHRDYTPNNMMFDWETEQSGIIDLEKSELEYQGKDLAKFTETVYIDGKGIGLSEEEIYAIQNTFFESYFENSRMNRSSLWSQLLFYQIYTSLSLLKYQLKRDDRQKAELIRDRVLALVS